MMGIHAGFAAEPPWPNQPPRYAPRGDEHYVK